MNRAFVRSAALCSLAKVALTRCSNAAYGSGSGGGAEEKSGARTKLAPGSGVSNAVFPGSIPRGAGGVGGTGGGGGGGGIIDGVNGAEDDLSEDDVSEDVASAAEGNDALTRSGPSKFPERVTTGAPSSFSVLFPNSSQALNPVLCMVTSLYSRSVVPGGSSTRPVQMFPSVHLSRNPSSGSHAPNTSASPTTPTCRP